MPFTLPPSKNPGNTLKASEWNNGVRGNWLLSALNIVTTAGDLVVATGNKALGRLAKGANGSVLKVVSGNVGWAEPQASDTWAFQITDQAGFADDADTDSRAGNLVNITLPSGWDGMWVITKGVIHWVANSQAVTYEVWLRGTINVTNEEDSPHFYSTENLQPSVEDRRKTLPVTHWMFSDQTIIFEARHEIAEGGANDATFLGMTLIHEKHRVVL